MVVVNHGGDMPTTYYIGKTDRNFSIVQVKVKFKSALIYCTFYMYV